MTISGGQQWPTGAVGGWWFVGVARGRQWWMVAVDGGGQRQQTVSKVNGERINWCEVRRYKIKGEKNGIK